MAPSDLAIRSQTIPDHTTVIIRHELSPYLNLQKGSMCDASPGDDRDGARLTRSCPIHLPPLQLYAEILRRSRGDVAAYIYIYIYIRIGIGTVDVEDGATRDPVRYRRIPSVWLSAFYRPTERSEASRSRLIYIVSTEPMREKFTKPSPQKLPESADPRRGATWRRDSAVGTPHPCVRPPDSRPQEYGMSRAEPPQGLSIPSAPHVR